MQKKYELTNEILITADGTPLRRIMALIDIPSINIKAGTKGGFIMSEENLSHEGNCWVGNDARVYGDAKIRENAVVRGAARVYDSAVVCGNAIIHNKANVFGNSYVHGNANIGGASKVYDNANIFDNAYTCRHSQVYGNSRVCGNAIITDCAKVFINAMIYDTAIVSGSAKVCGRAKIHGNVQLSDVITITHDADISKFTDFMSVKNIGNTEGVTTFYKDEYDDICMTGVFDGSLQAFQRVVDSDVHTAQDQHLSEVFNLVIQLVRKQLL